MMEYKGYIGKVEIDEEAGILYGEGSLIAPPIDGSY
jgi:hypothetical protein